MAKANVKVNTQASRMAELNSLFACILKSRGCPATLPVVGEPLNWWWQSSGLVGSNYQGTFFWNKMAAAQSYDVQAQLQSGWSDIATNITNNYINYSLSQGSLPVNMKVTFRVRANFGNGFHSGWCTSDALNASQVFTDPFVDTGQQPNVVQDYAELLDIFESCFNIGGGSSGGAGCIDVVLSGVATAIPAPSNVSIQFNVTYNGVNSGPCNFMYHTSSMENEAFPVSDNWSVSVRSLSANLVRFTVSVLSGPQQGNYHYYAMITIPGMTNINATVMCADIQALQCTKWAIRPGGTVETQEQGVVQRRLVVAFDLINLAGNSYYDAIIPFYYETPWWTPASGMTNPLFGVSPVFATIAGWEYNTNPPGSKLQIGFSQDGMNISVSVLNNAGIISMDDNAQLICQ